MENQQAPNTQGLTTANQSDRPENKICRCGKNQEPVWIEPYKLGDTTRKGFWIPADERCSECSTPEPEPEFTIEQMLNYINIPKAYMNMTFDNYRCAQENEKSYHLLTEYIEKPAGGLYVCGDCGVGKTHLVVALSRKLAAQKKNVRFEVVPELLLKIKTELFDIKSKSEEDLVSEYSKYKYLMLDDLGAEKVTEFTLQTLYLIFDRRMREGNTNIIITSNLTLDKIADRLSDRIASRIAGMCRTVRFQGDDHRLKRRGRL